MKIRPPVSRKELPLLLVAMLSATSCSISASIESLSNSISSPSASSSRDADEAYIEDVGDYAYEFARSPDDFNGFRRGIAELAEGRGITNWETDFLTCESIGMALSRADLDANEAREFGRKLFGDNATAQLDLQRGYDSSR